MSQALLLVLGAILALLGTMVQSIISWGQSRVDKRRDLLIEAYSEYLTGLAQRASILHPHSERTEQATALMVAGKQKISGFAPANVVKALAALEASPMLLSHSDTQEGMVGLVQAMRVSVGVGKQQLNKEIRDILFSAVRSGN
ncbi:hypothetical protein HPO_02437 [Hyphomonas polymorpha PS728]|uniref:Uncharacterized protein n=1 Tax=Hyphomonas polymorpha PS728 TaxID=1280954 RepID=A0A062VNC3_9PROT|nr:MULTISPECIES: hypothetical protein [Hyphomonas]AXE63067.1 hypothetical protein BBF93_01730 [Hyphomonas sp. CACIAM 19H1]KDA00235.1 hypothetical protein HPO_02437 [Hyphomonas polymorpha PS728]